MIESADEFVRLRTSLDPDEYHRAAHEEAPYQVWAEVIERFPEMRRWVAHNKTVPLEILDVLAVDPDPDVRWWVATKRKLTEDQFRLLAADPDDAVRMRVACNAKAPVAVLDSLVTDLAPLVREAATESLAGRRH